MKEQVQASGKKHIPPCEYEVESQLNPERDKSEKKKSMWLQLYSVQLICTPGTSEVTSKNSVALSACIVNNRNVKRQL